MLALRRAVQRPVSLQGVRYAHHNPHGHTGDPKEIEQEKQKNLKGQSESPVEGAPGWNEKLASDAEAKVKATKDTRSPQELQEDTANAHAAEQKKK
ncbi:hypothetical protein P389DRAFT_210253 [Cystobasidium minutum MCA 4210]|uniref:uncharacterized protein n=1 Tax=Cystobasidium minutum MCA 4210 TaxID=1397322 RepID=UPI0034CD7C20|eukprot:jgi/Rhomi1/210253/estExt_Genemark1.C_3_t20491